MFITFKKLTPLEVATAQFYTQVTIAQQDFKLFTSYDREPVRVTSNGVDFFMNQCEYQLISFLKTKRGNFMQVPDFVKCDFPLARCSTLGVGGRADYFTVINSSRILTAAYNFAGENQLDVLFLGRGSNILFSDSGFRGLVMRMNMRQLHYKFESDEFSVDAGVLVSDVVSLGEQLGFSGFEPFAGLPGTVGGAIYGNAGCYGGQFWDVVEEVTIFDGEYIKVLKKKSDMFGYRWSIFKDNPNWIIVAAHLKFEPKDRELVVAETKRIRELRQASQPKHKSVGCIFKNPPDGRSAGKLIHDCGLKGMQVGQAMISWEHANFFVNLGGARSSDFIELIKIAKGRVFEKFRILLVEEIIMVGEF